jgi:putative FmdB family regulatory protein
MPLYTYECSSCGGHFEEFASMSEYDPNNMPHCPRCDPECKEEPTLFRYMGDVRPAFQVKGEGAYDTRMK